MGLGPVRDLAGDWDMLAVLPGLGQTSGRAEFHLVGELLVQRTVITGEPIEGAEFPEGHCIVVPVEDGGYLQHYFDSRGEARLYAMSFDGRRWTLERTKADFAPLMVAQRYTGTVSDDGATIDGQWEHSQDGEQWELEFTLTYRRIG